MVRGRKRDVSAPLTRSLILQRDYRARKAKYISDLETRYQKLEADNLRLSKEVKDLKYQLRQKLDRKETLFASLTTEAETEKTRALNKVIFSLSSAAASIKSFQSLTRSDDYDAQAPGESSFIDWERGRPSPSSDHTGLSTNDIRPLQLYSPVSNPSPPSSLPTSSPRNNLPESWNPEFMAQNYSSDTNPVDGSTSRARHMRPQSAVSDQYEQSNVYLPSQGRSDPSVELSSSTQPGTITYSQSFFEHELSTASFRNDRSSNRPVSSYDRLHHNSTDQLIPFKLNEPSLPQDIRSMAPYSYERTLSQSLRNFV
ncbi:hypothetical protein C8J55DRAFT_554861 [Lentinula edodes]|uniref:BZIP domain-containing protein n=1 Tax=Lentinula lateritia TaxID=40482 RepID=A0A9W9E0E6_9AGAR|nr:hypothetical protein C8J55DRAFT_554861 [Lentinula edodes]